jgi:NhaA family Na+:H+ antiporter
VGWVQLAAVGLLGGIGFTVSLFVAGLAFTGPLADAAKVGILVASIVAGVAGGAMVGFTRPAARD